MAVGDVRVIVSRMVKVVAHSCRHQYAHVSHSQFLLRTTKQQRWHECVIKACKQTSREEFDHYGSQRRSHLKVAQVDHSVHHLADAEAVTEVMERVVAVIFLDCQLQLISIYLFFLNLC